MTEKLIRPILCTHLGYVAATPLVGDVKSGGNEKSRLVFEYYVNEDQRTSRKRQAISASVIQLTRLSRLTRPSRWFFSRYANIQVCNQDGMAGWVEVSLKSLSARYNIDFKLLKKAAKTNHRDITQFVQKVLTDDKHHYREISLNELESMPRQIQNSLPGQLEYDTIMEQKESNSHFFLLIMKKAVDKNYAPAMFELAKYYQCHQMTGYEIVMKTYFAQAASFGHIPSKLYYGILLLKKNGKDEWAIKMLKEAVNYGNETAFVILRYYEEIMEAYPEHFETFFANFLLEIQPEGDEAANTLEECLRRIKSRVDFLKGANDKQLKLEHRLLKSFRKELLVPN